jgi:serine/threonine protein kinase
MNQKIFEKYSKIRVIGSGHTSLVFLVSTTESNQLKPYALKSINKEKLVKQKQISQVKNEKSLHQSFDHPFIIKL